MNCSRILPVASVVVLLLVLLAGCGSSTETTVPPPSPTPEPPPPRLEFETTTDTIRIESGAGEEYQTVAPREVQTWFMVQIGAFKEPENASKLQLLARQRYDLPVVNDFSLRYGLYQIRIGFFENREAAYAFRRQLQREYPRDYTDAWIVQLQR